jgi:hypothetical protein
MRMGAYDSAVMKCNTCACWARNATPRAGKFGGLCRYNPPRVTHKRTLVPTMTDDGKQGMSIMDAETSGWPTTMEDDSCYQHVAVLSQ